MFDTYRSLLGPTDIRLLQLQPGPHGSRIECHIKHVDLDNDPAYEALSYVWGDPSNRVPIMLNGLSVTISVNLADALCRLRLATQPRIVWADALCINQDDLEERSRQVRLMCAIYSKALRVVVWLGQDTYGDVSHAMLLMTIITQTCEFNSQSRGRRWIDLTTDERFRYTDLPELGYFGDTSNASVIGTYWKALQTFFNRAWFHRIWCVQEISMARDSVLMCGDVDVPWRLAGITSTWLEAQNITHDFHSPSLIKHVDTEKALTMYHRADSDGLFDNLLEALSRHREFGATDPRDKVYAVLGLVNGDHSMIASVAIEYTKPVAEVYLDVAVAALDIYKDLFVLSFIQHPDEFIANTGFPSWVPRWDVSLSEATMIGQRNSDEEGWYTSEGRHLETFSITTDGGLRIHGYMYDTVSYVSELMEYTQFEHSAGVETPVKPPPFLYLWRSFIRRGKEIEDFRHMLRFARTLIGGLAVDWSLERDFEQDERLAFYADFFAYVNHISRLFGPLDKDTDSGETASFADPRSDTYEWVSEGGEWQRYSVAASRMCDHRRFFFVKNHLDGMGIGPAAMRRGDIVAILFGARVPFILRPVIQHDVAAKNTSTSQSHPTRRFYLVGEAFIADIMHGEVMERIEKQEEQLPEEYFELI